MRKQVPWATDKVYAALSVVGGAVMIASFFLPWQIGTKVPSVNGPNNFAVLSIWDNISRVAFGGGSASFDPATGSTMSQSSAIVPALVMSVPMILAAIIVVLGIWALLRQSGPVRAGLYFAAATLATLTSLQYIELSPYYSQLYSGGSPAIAVSNVSLIGVASATMTLGLLLLIMAGVASAARRSMQSSHA